MAIAAALFLFIGSVGITVFSHVCEEDGLNVSYFIPSETVCAGHEHENHELEETCSMGEKACCCKEETSKDDGCCSLSSELVKVDLDFLNKLDVKAVIIPVLEIAPVWEIEDEVVFEEVRIASGNDPPPIRGKSLLTYHQQWLI